MIIFDGKTSIIAREESKIDTMKRASYLSSTTLTSNDKEEYSREEEDEEEQSISLVPSIGPVWLVSILALDDPNIGDTLSWGSINSYSNMN